MKILLLTDYMLGNIPLLAGQMAIVSDEDGAAAITAGAAEALAENTHGCFSVPMFTELAVPVQ
jgi:hypothetical protein